LRALRRSKVTFLVERTAADKSAVPPPGTIGPLRCIPEVTKLKGVFRVSNPDFRLFPRISHW
jgi:hypothetical protein